MHVYLYRLRAEGKPLSHSEVAGQQRWHGFLVYGPWNGPARAARVMGAGERVLAQLMTAEVLRISNRCVLLQGQEGGRPQTWLCAVDEKAGKAALRILRPPTAAELALGAFDEDLDDDDDEDWSSPPDPS